MTSATLYHYHLDEGAEPYGVIAVAGGQSNAGNLFSGSLNASGKIAFLEAIDAAITDENDFINGSEGSSFLSKNAADNASSVEYWVNDDTGTLAAGPELEDFYEAVTAAGYANADVTHVVWAQGESDASRIANGTITKANYKTAMEWLFDDFRDTFSNLESIVIIPIGPRTVSSPGTQQVREVQQEVADVLLAAEVYDQPLADSVHFTEEAYAVIGDRLAKRLLRGLGESVTHAVGPHVSDVDFSGTTITLTVTHDGGTTLNGFTSTPVDATASSGDNFFRCFDGNGVELTISTVEVTAADEITITLAFQPIGNFTLYGGYGAMEGVTDTDTFITDGTLPLRTFNAAIAAALTNLTTNVVSIFSAAENPGSPGTALYFNNAAGTGATAWSKLAGAAGNARRDDTKAQPTWHANSNMGLAIPGVYFDGSTSMKLLVEHALTGSSDYTLFIAVTPDHDATDPSAGSATNALISTSGVATSDNALFGISQTRTALGTLTYLSRGSGSGFDGGPFNSVPVVLTMQKSGTDVSGWDSTDGLDGASPLDTAAGTSQIDDTNSNGTGTPLYAIGNDVDKPMGNDTLRAFLGAVHYVVLISSAVSTAQRQHIEGALKDLVGI